MGGILAAVVAGLGVHLSHCIDIFLRKAAAVIDGGNLRRDRVVDSAEAGVKLAAGVITSVCPLSLGVDVFSVGHVFTG